jgi:hypothetical protein
VEGASEAVAGKFSRMMRAATSRWGVLTDPVVVCTAIAALVTASSILYQTTLLPPGLGRWLFLICLAPAAIALAIDRALGGARARVVAWLEQVPFAMENVNALLNGVGQNLMVRFREAPPDRAVVNEALEAVHPDCFALEYSERDHEVEVAIGVVDRKLNPSRSNHERYRRVQEIVARALVPLAEKHAIVSVRVR